MADRRGAKRPADARGAMPQESSFSAGNTVWIQDLDLTNVSQSWGTPQAGRSVGGAPITLAGTVYAHGLGTHAFSRVIIDLHRSAIEFDAIVGVDDEKMGHGSVTFSVIVDGIRRVRTGVLHGGDAPQRINVDLRGAKRMVLAVGDGGDGIDSDHADWADARIVLVPHAVEMPNTVVFFAQPLRMVVPTPPEAPSIHGPDIVGATPGRPFLFLVPATGAGSLRYAAANLPGGLTIDHTTGIISGSLLRDGSTDVRIIVENSFGTAKRILTIVGGTHKLALTPQMGWNSWYAWADHVDDAVTRDAADEIVSTGLAAHGYQYVNIDDTWEAGRDSSGTITGNDRFPDMAALGSYIHAKGLKFGIYSSPGPTTCGGYPASYQHEDQDAATFAAWGVDYLKYDWCSYGSVAGGNSTSDLQKPYAVMRASLDKASRDIVFSFCQYGMGDVWAWGAALGGNLWRTTGDMDDDWSVVDRYLEAQNGLAAYAGPGHWNDPDMLMIGQVGVNSPHMSRLAPNEQMLQMSMWCMLAAPLMISSDPAKLDAAGLAILTNDELIAIDQDRLGRAATRVAVDGDGEIWARPLVDGSTAVALVNTGEATETVSVTWPQIGRHGPQIVRDLWLHRSLGIKPNGYNVSVDPHCVVVLKLTDAYSK